MAKMSGLGSSNSGNRTKKKNNKSKSRPDAVAMKAKAPKPNPFETIWSRRKFDILGKKRKGEERRVGLARSRAIEKRKNTLLKEYEQSGKASVFVDKRIGEDKEGMGEFEKAILRSQREYKLKLNKKSKYNLSDGEEDDHEYEAGAFMGRDDFEDEMLPDDDDDGGGAETAGSYKKSSILKQLFTQGANSPETNGIEGEENRHKSKKEVMEEIIFKSKLFKAQKAKDKEENEQLMEDLDKNFTSLVQSEALLSLTEPGKMSALKALVNQSVPKEPLKITKFSATEKAETFAQEKPDTYDKLVKEMSLDMRARPSDRTKTLEEIAQEERERLEQLEEERKKRMLATDDNSDEDDEDDEKPSAKKIRSLSGDDLGDSFSVDEQTQTKKGWVDEILEREAAANSDDEDEGSSEESDSAENDSGSDDDKDDHDKTYLLKDWEQSDDERLDADLEEEEEEEEEEREGEEDYNDASENSKEQVGHLDNKTMKNVDVHENKKKVANFSEGTSILPFLIEAPTSLEEFNVLLENRSNSDIILLISRIRASNAIALAAENRKKMQVFYGVLLQYFAILASKKPLNFQSLNMLVKPLVEMSTEIPYFAAICARQRILRTRTQFCEVIKNSETSSWPSLKTLFLLRLWSLIFPCSDFRHVVMTPAVLLMCEYLMRCPVLSGRDVALGAFLCSMLLSVTKQSQKFCPEAIMFLETLLSAAMDRKIGSNQNSQFGNLIQFRVQTPLLCIREGASEFSPLNFLKIIDMPDESPFFSSDGFRASVLASMIETLSGFAGIYGKLSSFPEIFMPISSLLLEVAQQQNMPNELRNKFEDVAQLIKRKADEHQMLRQPLQLRKRKPVPIKQLNPKFEENFVKGRDYDPDRERAERRKLKKLIKQEAKGAVRELRKDNYFLFEVKEREKASLEQERLEKYGRAKSFLQEQEHAFKSGQLGKGRKRRR
ncbi:nucleolar protein 14 isoform X1 [Rhodamnia argentea]|uniref:Nucleolar protein 14 isoform X1 n=1 Tax=Rhodamnia argentea TaxID=178133 RepID=A0A8B8MLQ4_9MYRT|nr:nucleolar protein 14 isoform X1 [Rhodamnia argentea]